MENDETKTNPAEMNEKELPDVRAFEDEFTRSFLQSTEEIKPGYYPFVSGTGAYKIDFPSGGTIDQKSYAQKEDGYEGLLIGVENENGIGSLIKVNYYSYKKNGEEESSIDALEKRVGEDLNFEKNETKHQTFYNAPFTYGDNEYGIASFIQNKQEGGAIYVIYTAECVLSKQECTDAQEKKKKDILDWIGSIEFLNNKGESE